MFQLEQKPEKKSDKNNNKDVSSQINPAEMLREQNLALQRNSGILQTKTVEEEPLKGKSVSDSKMKKTGYSWKPYLDKKKNLMLKKRMGDNADTLIQQIIDSGYEVSDEMRENIETLVENMSGRAINLTENANLMAGDFRTVIELISAQARLDDEDNNCVNLTLVTLDEYKNSPEDNKILSKNYGESWKSDTQNTLSKGYTDEDQTLKGGKSVFISRDPDIDDEKKNIKHASRFFLKGKNGKIYAIHKYASGKNRPLQVRGHDQWSDGKMGNPSSVYNPVEK
jgi:hypothetical protein